jgi:2-methylcitrate dehydratase PrpD
VALRERVTATIEPGLKGDQARIVITLRDGRRLDKFVEHVIGSRERPMSDADIEGKYAGLVEGILEPDRAHRLMELCWRANDMANAGELGRAAAVA